MKLWNALTGQLLQTFASPPAPLIGVKALAWFNNDSQIISSHLGDGDSQTVFWDVATGNLVRSLQIGDVLVMRLNRPQSLLAFAGFVGGIVVFESISFTRRSIYPPMQQSNNSAQQVTQIVWSSDHRYIVAGNAGGQIAIWNDITKQPVRTLETTNSENQSNTLIHAIYFDDNVFHLKALNGEGRLIVWDTQTWQIVSQQQLNGACVWDGQPFDPCIPYSADWSPDGRMLAYAAGPTLQVIPAPDLATPTPTPTSTVTPTSTPAPVSLRLQYYPDPDARGNLVESIEPDVNLVNTGSQAIPLSSLKIRYYFTRENPAVPVRVKCWFTALPGGCATVTGQVVALNPPVSGADSYLEIGFTGGTLAAGASTGEVLVGANKTDWSDFDQHNDYSHTRIASD